MKKILQSRLRAAAQYLFLKSIQIPVKEDCVFKRSCVRIELFRVR